MGLSDRAEQLSPRRRGRPPRDEALLADARARLLREGVAILTERGFSGLGLDEILTVAGVPKGSFYHYFGSKADFGLALIDAYSAYFVRKLDRWFLDESLSPLNRLRSFIEDARSGVVRFDYRRGCLVGNLGQEIVSLPDQYRERLASVFQAWEARTAVCLEKAKAEGEISADTDCSQMAAFFWIGWEGAVLRAKVERSDAPLRDFSNGFLKLISNLTEA